MCEYNAKNYTEQGGDVTHIGGQLIFEDGASMKGGLVPNQEAETPSSDTVAKVRSSLNSLITNLKNAGIMEGDSFSVVASLSVDDKDPDNADRTYNTSKISDVEQSNGVITLNLEEKVKDLKDFDAGDEKGIHKWMGIAIKTGFDVLTDLYVNGTQLTSDDEDEAESVGLEPDAFVLWIKADSIIKGSSNTFTLWASGYKETEYKLVIVEPEDSGE